MSLFTNCTYGRSKTFKDCYIEIEKNVFAEIQYFVKSDEKRDCYVRLINTVPFIVGGVEIGHIKTNIGYAGYTFVSIQKARKIISIEFEGKKYFCRMPNSFDRY